MFESALIAALLAMLAGASMWGYRAAVYRDLGQRHAEILRRGPSISSVGRESTSLPSFEDRLAVLPNPLLPEEFARIASEIERLSTTERSYVPSHKKGGTIAYDTLCKEAPAVVAFYQSQALRSLVSRIVGVDVVPTPLHDQSSCSVLCYERPGDHIGWHYDHNFYNGRHFTVLIPLVNRNRDASDLSAARLHARIGSEDRQIPTPPNTLVVFEGARVLHKATPIADGERRILLSMTFCADPRNTIGQGIARRIKDMAFFGIRALWT